MPDDNEFLEMRVASGGELVPPGLDGTVPVRPYLSEYLPCGLQSCVAVLLLVMTHNALRRDLRHPPTRRGTSYLTSVVLLWVQLRRMWACSRERLCSCWMMVANLRRGNGLPHNIASACIT